MNEDGQFISMKISRVCLSSIRSEMEWIIFNYMSEGLILPPQESNPTSIRANWLIPCEINRSDIMYHDAREQPLVISLKI